MNVWAWKENRDVTGWTKNQIDPAQEEMDEAAAKASYDGNADRLAAEARRHRNALLQGCDWTQLNDAPISEQQIASWNSYRQNLRDVPSQQGFPQSITWPVAP